jgi:hypothetical protein
MKEFFLGLWALIWAIAVSGLMFTVGILYSFGYSIWLSITLKKWYAFITFWFRLIDGFLGAIGHFFYESAYSLDLGWNVNGEIIEDLITTEESTTFTKKNISVSASVGKLEIEGKLNKSGERFSKTLNIFFWQKNHAVDAWNYTQARIKLKEQYFDKR